MFSCTGEHRDPVRWQTQPASTGKGWLDRLIPPLLSALDPGALLRKRIRFRNGKIEWGGRVYRIAPNRSVYVVGAGKGSARMAEELEKILGDAVAGGVVVTRYGYAVPCRKIRIIEAGHPIPDRKGEEGARSILDLARKAKKGDLVIGLWSGGGSALLPLPIEGVSLEAKQGVTELLLRSGATIGEINAVRKHLSRIKGGRLAREVGPARMVNFILSDVVGDRLDVIASGPTVPDPTTFSDAIGILKRYRLWEEIDPSIRSALEEGQRGERPETLKRLGPRIKNILIGNGERAANEATRILRKIGFDPQILTTTLEGESSEVAKALVAIAKDAQRQNKKKKRSLCLIAAGETTVTVRGRGRGGRCQEFVLSAALSLEGTKGITVAAFSTDGIDGPTDAAGAFADGETVRQAARKGIDARKMLEENDAYRFFDKIGGLIRTGPTRTHLNDLYLLMTNQTAAARKPTKRSLTTSRRRRLSVRHRTKKRKAAIATNETK
jgi:hydroxypyruvate reductase